MMWVFLTAFYGVAKGARDAIKKKAVEKSGVMEVLFFHTLLGFIFTLPFSRNVFDISFACHLWVLLKSFSVFLAWILAMYAIRKMPVSFYGIMDSSRMIFSTVLAIVFLGESMTLPKGIGLLLVLSGLAAVNLGNSREAENIKIKYVLFSLFACLLNAVSGVLDKFLLAGGNINSSQLQFWYMLYMTLLYGTYILVTRTPLKLSTLKTNYWIVILSALFIAADRALFIANADPNSQVTVMTLVKQSSVIVTVLTGWLFFKEKHIIKRVICAVIVLSGIAVATLM